MIIFIAEISAQRRLAAVTPKLTRASVSVKQIVLSETNTLSSLPCGKICSYEWDTKEDGKYYPLLRKSVNCANIFYRIAHSPYPVIRPPPRRPPSELISDYTINDQCPISHFEYYDNSSPAKKLRTRFSANMFQTLLRLDNVTNINHYKDKNVLKPALIKYKHIIQGKRVAVVGTLDPWAEAMLVNLGASRVITIEYTELVIEHKRVETITPYRVAEQFINRHAVPFDAVFSYSSIEHSGLGRYGDPLTPFGDFEAMAQVWCMVKPGGHFVLAVMGFSDDRNKCSVVWNAHRIYGVVRLQHLTANWRVLEELEARDYRQHRIFLLEKV